MHDLEAIKSDIIDNILHLTRAAIKQTNKNAVFHGPTAEDWDYFGVLNAVHAGELCIKAVISMHHPLLIFRELPTIKADSEYLSLKELIERGRSYDLSKLPQILWAVTGEKIADKELFDATVNLRNSIQHFVPDISLDFRMTALSFLYTIVDPLIVKNFGIYPIECHDNEDDYGYVVEQLIHNEIEFSMPNGFTTKGLEGDVIGALKETSEDYRNWFQGNICD